MTKRRMKIFILLAVMSGFVCRAEIPAGYYHLADSLRGAALLDALNRTCSDGVFLGYGSGSGYTWQGFFSTDRDSASGRVLDMYSSTERYQTSFAAVDGMHIEHSFPKSWWGGLENYAYRDLNHLFPADGTANIIKNNLPLGLVGSATFDNGVSKIGNNVAAGASGNCFEPADEYKGDFARAYLYMAAVYNELSAEWQSPMMDNNTYPVWKPWALDLLMQWHRQDTVSDKERARQEAVYAIQHNRNPFIDYPGLAEHIWGDKQNEDFVLEADLRPYLVSPAKWDRIETEPVFVGSEVECSIEVRGRNLSSPLRISLAGNSAGVALSDTALSAAQAEAGTRITVRLSADSACSIVDTLLISGQEVDSMRIPLRVLFTDQFMMTSFKKMGDEAVLSWTALPDATSYDVEIQRPAATTGGDLFISDYVEGSSWNKAVAIFNPMGDTVDLSNYSLGKQNNGTGSYRPSLYLSGILAPGEQYVLVHGKASAQLKAKADTVTSNDQADLLSFNGNDAIVLYHNGILIDVVGVLGSSSFWGGDLSMKRKADVTSPHVMYLPAEWELMPVDDFSGLDSHSVVYPLSATTEVISGVSEPTLHLALAPSSSYTAFVTAQPGNVRSANGWRYSIAGLDAPAAYGATAVYNTRLTANWESVPLCEGYLLSLYTKEGDGADTVAEGFDGVGSNGLPLPDGWTGTASGSYTSSSSSGQSAPAIALKSDGEWLQTPAYGQGIDSLSFLYKFNSGREGSCLEVYAMDSQGASVMIDSLPFVDNSKAVRTYSGSDLGGDVVAVRFVYKKAGGNIGIDDVVVVSGSETRVDVARNLFVGADSARYTFTSLTSETDYYFSLRAVVDYGTAYEMQSRESNVIRYKTNSVEVPTGTVCDLPQDGNVRVWTDGGVVFVDGDADGAELVVYDIAGRIVSSRTGCRFPQQVKIDRRGVYLIRVDNQIVKVSL